MVEKKCAAMLMAALIVAVTVCPLVLGKGGGSTPLFRRGLASAHEFSNAGGAMTITCTILYDNYDFVEGGKADWGFSCLIEGAEKTILFDTGTKSDILLHNVDLLGVDLTKIDMIVISHNHGDHTGGLTAVLERVQDVTVYVPVSFPDSFIENVEKAGARAMRIADPVEICENVFLTGEMGVQIKEQSLILDTSGGLVIVTGCSHQGIVSILNRAVEIRDKDIYLVFGGFHLMEHSERAVHGIIDEFKKIGVQKCGATHCTGDAQIKLFQEAYGKNYVPMGVGRVINIEHE